MTDSVKDQLAADLEKAKTEGGIRTARIREIVKAAASEAIVEVKAGSQELGSIARNSFTTVATSWNTASENVASERTVSENNTGVQDSVEDSANAAPASVDQQLDRYKTLILSFLRLLKQQLGNLDLQLSQRYGDRYQTVKQQLEQSATWYSTQLEQAKATPTEPTPLEQKQIELTAQAGAAGTIVAQKEQQIKQQLKEMMQTAAQK